MNVSDKSKLIPSASESLLDTGHTLPAGLTCGSGKATGMNLLISSAEASPARGQVLQEKGEVSLTTEPHSSGKSSGLRKQPSRRGGYSRMFQGSLALLEDKTSTPLFTPYKRAGLLSAGELWTADFSTSPNDANESSLSAVLQSQVSGKYYLSPRAAAGILRRAEKRGRELPLPLEAALKDLASTWQEEAEKTT